MPTESKLGIVLGLGLVILTAVTYAPRAKATATPNQPSTTAPRISLQANPME